MRPNDLLTRNHPIIPGLLVVFMASQIFCGAKVMAQADQTSLRMEILGTSVNTEDSEFVPVISVDGKTLYFCRAGRTQAILDESLELFGMSWDEVLEKDKADLKKIVGVAKKKHGQPRLDLFVKMLKHDEDSFFSRFENGVWSTAQSMGSPLNDPLTNDSIETISADNNHLLLFRDANLYTCERDSANWSSPVLAKGPFNSKYWDGDVCISADGLTYFFVSNRPGYTTSKKESEKNKDIWVVENRNGNWSEPVNIGPTVNTPGIERTPFLHPDGRTLYFASTGHEGKGKLDCFKTSRLNDSDWTAWSEPENLTSINTEGSDWGLKMPANSEWAYMSSHSDEGYGKNDIYRVKVDETLAPVSSVILIAGVVTSTDGKPLAAKVQWEALETGELLGVATSNAFDGKFAMTLPAGRAFGYFVTADGFWDNSNHIDLTELAGYEEKVIDITMVPIDNSPSSDEVEGNEIVLNNIFFDFDSYNLNKSSHSELNRLARKLSTHGMVAIEIQGHTDDIGGENYNHNLSRQRAEAVRQYLVTQGISGNRLQAHGYGETVPVDASGTEAGRSKNRRVSFVVLSELTASNQ